MRGTIHHVDLSVTDIQAARALYEPVLAFMGYRLAQTYPIGFDWDRVDGDSFTSIGIRASSGPNARRPHDRYSPGLHHLAWRAPSREDVDALHALLVELGATVLDPPADYPEYGDGYYAVFFADPDGLKLEYVYKP